MTPQTSIILHKSWVITIETTKPPTNCISVRETHNGKGSNRLSHPSTLL